MNVPVHVGADPTQIAESDQVITQVVPLRSVQAPQLVRDLQPLLGESAVLTANADSNTLVITDTTANVRRLVEVIAAMDQTQASAVEVRVFPLQYAQASDAARLINEVFVAQKQAGTGGNRREEMMRAFIAARRGGEDGQVEASANGVPLTASADDRTNTLVVSGPPEMLEVIDRVVREIDSNPTVTQGVFIYAVNNGDAGNLETILNKLFGTSSGSSSRTGATNGSTSVRSTGRRTTTSQSAAPAGPGFPGGPGGFMDAMRQGFTNQLTQQALQSAGDLYGQVYVVADEDSNSLMVMAAPAYFDAVRQIIVELDAPVPQVLIKVLVAEVTHSDSLDLGVEFSVLNAPDASTLFTDFGLENATGGMIYRLLENDVTATLRALEEVGRLEVLSRPYILASDNQLATITVGSEVPFITNTQFTELGGVRNTIRYEDVGIILNVTPHIAPDAKVTMEVEPEISALSGETVMVAENVFLPVIEKRSASTRVAIRDGQTIVIGGLMEDRKTADIDKVPLLGDIPLVGALFRRERTVKRKTELLIFLTPHVAMEPNSLETMSRDEIDRTQIVPEAIESGAYRRHLDEMMRRPQEETPTPRSSTAPRNSHQGKGAADEPDPA